MSRRMFLTTPLFSCSETQTFGKDFTDKLKNDKAVKLISGT